MKKAIICFWFFGFVALYSCQRDPNLKTIIPYQANKVENAIVIVMDGARYSETCGDSSLQYISLLYNYFKEYGVICTNFHNQGKTLTVPGHTAITTGHYQYLLDNLGILLPEKPSMFQYYIEQHGGDTTRGMIVTSKGKLHVLANSEADAYKNKLQPIHFCGVDGSNFDYANDSTTRTKAIQWLRKYKPNLSLIQFKEPDYSGHAHNWEAYLQGIKSTSEYIMDIIRFVNQDSFYSNNTAIFITNDHGRHLDSEGGFSSHGDNCEGCRHIFLMAVGPTIKQQYMCNKPYELIDISATIASMLQFQMPSTEGKVMVDLLK